MLTKLTPTFIQIDYLKANLLHVALWRHWRGTKGKSECVFIFMFGLAMRRPVEFNRFPQMCLLTSSKGLTPPRHVEGVVLPELENKNIWLNLHLS